MQFRVAGMDDVVKQLARELAAAMGSAVARDARVAACRDKARAAGYEMQVALEALIGFGQRARSEEPAETETPAGEQGAEQLLKITADDRRFLRSLRIATGKIGQHVE